jgi:hypothetical protein
VLRLGRYAEHAPSDEHCLAYVREAGGEAGAIVLSTGLDRDGEAVAGELELGPAEGVVIAVNE